MAEYRELFEKIPDGVTLHDPASGAILTTNEQFCEMLGYSREELLEKDFAELIPNEPPYTRERVQEYIQKAATDGPQTFEWRDVTKSGAMIPVEVHLRETTIDGHRRILAVVRDISDRKERELELQLRTERLERFAAVVSHDLRNPLTVAQGRLELVREKCDSDDLEAIEEAHARMDILLEDLLELTQFGPSAEDAENVELSMIVTSCWQTVETKEGTLENHTTHTLRTDISRLQQLLENLFRNAIEHGGPDVQVTVGNLENGFYIQDDGPGITEETRDRIFEAGFTTTDEGTGYGLQIVSNIVADHGWEITATDAENGGARIEVTGVTLRE
jgi:PAS domain S-box-containing protein